MSRRRFAPVLVLSLLLQVTLAGQGTLCVVSHPGAATSPASGNTDMPGMPMPSSPGSKSPARGHPLAPATCQPLASCASVVVGAPAVARAEAFRPERIAALVALEPDSRSTRPETPPPRV